MKTNEILIEALAHFLHAYNLWTEANDQLPLEQQADPIDGILNDFLGVTEAITYEMDFDTLRAKAMQRANEFEDIPGTEHQTTKN